MHQTAFLDGNSLINRAYYGLARQSRLTAADGTPTGAIFAFLNMLLQYREQLPADLWAVAFDLPEPTFRHQLYDEYKAGRAKMPEDLALQFPIIKDLLRELGYTLLERPGYEADDVLGSAAAWSEREGYPCTLITGDRDSYQLIRPEVTVLMPKSAQGKTQYLRMDAAAIEELYGLSVDQLIDLKALMGDSSDHIPGAKGIGEKTAIRLLQAYSDLDGVYAHLAELKESERRKLEESRELVELSRRLAEIDCSLDLGLAVEKLQVEVPDPTLLAAHLQALGLQSILERLQLQGVAASVAPTQSWQERREATNLAALQAEKLLVALPQEGSRQLYVYSAAGPWARCSDDEFKTFLKDWEAAAEPGRQLLLRDAKAFLHRLAEYQDRPCVRDLSLAAYLLGQEGQNSDSLDWERIYALVMQAAMPPLPEAGQGQASFFEDPTLKERHESAKADLAFAIWERAEVRLQDLGLWRLYSELELPLLFVLARMEAKGIALDVATLEKVAAGMREELGRLEEAIYGYADGPLNINSPQQLSQLLFEDLGLRPSGKKLKSGAYSTAVEALQPLLQQHPIIALILRYREISKLLSTFVEGLAKEVAADGRIHSRFNQFRTATGRLSSSHPNLQNIPVRSEFAEDIRRAFVPSPGTVFLDADYSQIELRLLAAFSGDEALLRAYREGQDIHRLTASKLFAMPEEAVGARERRIGKTVNFSIIYGISAFGLAQDLECSVKQAEAYIEAYHRAYPRVQQYMDEVVEEAKKQGYVETLWGRRRQLPELQSRNYNLRQFGMRAAMNAPIQGTAADLIKKAMLDVDQALRAAGLAADLLLQVHDELLLEVRESDAAAAAEILQRSMEGAMELAVPLVAEVHRMTAWGKA